MLDILKAMGMLRDPDVVINLETFHLELVKFLKYLKDYQDLRHYDGLEVEENDFIDAGQKYLDFLKSFGIDLEEAVNQNHSQG